MKFLVKPRAMKTRFLAGCHGIDICYVFCIGD